MLFCVPAAVMLWGIVVSLPSTISFSWHQCGCMALLGFHNNNNKCRTYGAYQIKTLLSATNSSGLRRLAIFGGM